MVPMLQSVANYAHSWMKSDPRIYASGMIINTCGWIVFDLSLLFLFLIIYFRILTHLGIRFNYR